MPIGTPHTWASAEALTSTVLKAENEDQWTALWSPPRARLDSVNTATIASQAAGTLHTTAGAGNLVTFFNAIVDTYTGTMTSGSTGAWDGLVAPIAGIYEVHGQFSFEENATGQRCAILKQGSVIMDVDPTLPCPTTGELAGPGGGFGATSLQVFGELKMAANDKVQLFGTQSSGGGLDLISGYGCLELVWVGNTA